ncbi:hypothetical protein DFP72DRAFT_133759 [Ephemerocybe angulata]|uniref:DUF1996 domain-containing protein n=1 Tax=Ephemerocybe angulata TaxID=980116 RepID=A0A8H6MBT2_9AGAR|nr:hypothetical protein DFP72DRAFT_133759 [Tulosesus angulatus]
MINDCSAQISHPSDILPNTFQTLLRLLEMLKLLHSLSALVLFSIALRVDGLLRFPCSQLVTERFDPLVTPGQVSPHLHQIVGGVRST